MYDLDCCNDDNSSYDNNTILSDDQRLAKEIIEIKRQIREGVAALKSCSAKYKDMELDEIQENIWNLDAELDELEFDFYSEWGGRDIEPEDIL